MGRPVRLIQSDEPHPGAQVITTIDRRIQEAAERAMEGKAGAVVVMDPRNGDVLAHGLDARPSRSTASPGTIDRDAWLRLIQDPNHPLLNRAIQSQYPPGSVFKIDRRRRRAAGRHAHADGPDALQRRVPPRHVDLQGLEEGRARHAWTCIERDRAVVRHLLLPGRAQDRRRRRSPSTREAFGLGAPTGIDLGGEKPGLIPQPKVPRKGRRDHLACRRDREHVDRPGRGAGDADAGRALHGAPSPTAACCGSRGWSSASSARTKGVVWSDAGSVNGHVELSPMVWAFLRQSPVGGRQRRRHRRGRPDPRARHRGQDRHRADHRQVASPSKGQDHAWFAVLRAGEDPEVVVVVLVERGGKGGQVGGADRAADPERDLLREGGRERGCSRVGARRDGRDRPPAAAERRLAAAGRRRSSSSRSSAITLWPASRRAGPAAASPCRQLAWFGVGLVGAASWWPARLPAARAGRARCSTWSASVALVAVFVLGRTVSGARRWILLGPAHRCSPPSSSSSCFVLMAGLGRSPRAGRQPVGKIALIAGRCRWPWCRSSLIVKQPDLGHRAAAVPGAGRPARRGRAAAAAPRRTRPRRAGRACRWRGSR